MEALMTTLALPEKHPLAPYLDRVIAIRESGVGLTAALERPFREALGRVIRYAHATDDDAERDAIFSILSIAEIEVDPETSISTSPLPDLPATLPSCSPAPTTLAGRLGDHGDAEAVIARLEVLNTLDDYSCLLALAGEEPMVLPADLLDRLTRDLDDATRWRLESVVERECVERSLWADPYGRVWVDLLSRLTGEG